MRKFFAGVFASLITITMLAETPKTTPAKPKKPAFDLSAENRIHNDRTIPIKLEKAVNPYGGSLKCRVRFDFDPTARTKENKTCYRNQMFIQMYPPRIKGKIASAMLYSCLVNYCYIVRSYNRQMLVATGGRYPFKGHKWYNLELRWGKELELFVNGKKTSSCKFNGLFGPLYPGNVDVRLGADVRMASIKNNFSIANVEFLPPKPDAILGCTPRCAYPLLDGMKPVLDGKLDDAFWKKACKVTGFVSFKNPVLTENQPEIYSAYTNDGIYLAAKIKLPPGANPQAVLKKRDAGIYSEDTLEIRFVTPAKKCYTFMFSAAGTKYDSVSDIETPHNGVVTYNPEWRVVTAGEAGEWRGEAFIPFKALEVDGPPKPWEIWRAGYFVDRATGFDSCFTWAFTNRNFVDPAFFGEIVFSGEPRTMRFDSITDYISGKPVCVVELVGSFNPVINLKGKCYNEFGELVTNRVFPIRDTQSATFKTGFLKPGMHKILLSCEDEKGREWLRQSFFFKPKIETAIKIDNYPYLGYAIAEVSAGKFITQAKQTNVALSNAAGQQLLKAQGKFKDGTTNTKLPTDQLKPGKYVVSAVILDAAGKQLGMAKTDLEIFPKPSWWKNNLAIGHIVPPPWTPVKQTATGLSVWGRNYVYNGKVFPGQIISQKHDQFASAPKLLLDGKYNLLDVKSENTVTFPDEVIYKGSGNLGPYAVTSCGELEFDGCFRYDFTIAPKSGEATVKSLILDLPVPTGLAKFLHSSNGLFGNVDKVEKAMSMGFTPNLWLGNHDQGLAVVFESDQYWTPSGSKSFIQVIPRGNETILRINFITRPRKITKPISFTMGLMATPVKPMLPNDLFSYTKWYSPYKKLRRGEQLKYSQLSRLSPDAGTIELQYKPETATKVGNAELFHLFAGKKPLITMQYDVRNRLRLLGWNGRKAVPLLSGTPAAMKPGFNYVALSWGNGNASLFVNGKMVASKPMPPQLLGSLKAVTGPGGILTVGSRANWIAVSPMNIDEVRVSSAARYTGDYPAPTVPFAGDAKTVLLDHLDETFRPDGFDAETKGGGIPSVGAKFVSGKFGNALQMISEPVKTEEETLIEMKNDLYLIWDWELDSRLPSSAVQPGQARNGKADRNGPPQQMELHQLHGLSSAWRTFQADEPVRVGMAQPAAQQGSVSAAGRTPDAVLFPGRKRILRLPDRRGEAQYRQIRLRRDLHRRILPRLRFPELGLRLRLHGRKGPETFHLAVFCVP